MIHYLIVSLDLIYIGIFIFFSSYPKGASLHTILILESLIVAFVFVLIFSKNSNLFFIFYLFYVIEWLYIKRKSNNYFLPTLMVFIQHFSLILSWLLIYNVPAGLNLIPKLSVSVVFIVASLILLSAVFLGKATDLINRKTLFFSTIYSKKENKKHSIAFLLSVIVSMVIQLLLNGDLYETEQRIISNVFIILYSFYLFALLSYSIQKEKQHQLSLLNKIITEQEEKYQNSNAFQHDFKNILIVLKEYIAENRMEEALQYILSIEDFSQFKFLKRDLFKQLSLIKVFPLNALIQNFIYRCYEEDVRLSFYIPEEITNIKMTDVDLTRCISILLDNALDAVMLEKNKIIELNFYKNGTYLVFELKNSSTHPVEIEKITKKGITSKQGHSGLGLNNLNHILRDYPSIHFTFRKTDTIFLAQIVFTII